MTYDELKGLIKEAMKAHDKVCLSILRQVHGELKNIEVDERREVTDADVDAMLKRVIKQTKETLEGSIKAANNQERTDTLAKQVEILEGLLPKQISGDELIALIDATRKHPMILRGASPRATLSLTAMAKAVAYVQRRDYVVPKDIQVTFPQVIAHRLLLAPEAGARQITPEQLLDEILHQVPSPRL